MANKEDARSVSEVQGLDQFEPGHRSGPIDDVLQREKRLNSLPEGEKELAMESARFADLCQYLSQKSVAVPAPLLDELGRISRLKVAERAARMKALNRELMEHLNDVNQDSGRGSKC